MISPSTSKKKIQIILFKINVWDWDYYYLNSVQFNEGNTNTLKAIRIPLIPLRCQLLDWEGPCLHERRIHFKNPANAPAKKKPCPSATDGNSPPRTI